MYKCVIAVVRQNRQLISIHRTLWCNIINYNAKHSGVYGFSKASGGREGKT